MNPVTYKEINAKCIATQLAIATVRVYQYIEYKHVQYNILYLCLNEITLRSVY